MVQGVREGAPPPLGMESPLCSSWLHCDCIPQAVHHTGYGLAVPCPLIVGSAEPMAGPGIR